MGSWGSLMWSLRTMISEHQMSKPRLWCSCTVSLAAYCLAWASQRLQLPSLHSKVREVISSREIWRLACFICCRGMVVAVQGTNSIVRALMLREAVHTAISKTMNEGLQLGVSSAVQTNLSGLSLYTVLLTYSPWSLNETVSLWLVTLHSSGSYSLLKLLTHHLKIFPSFSSYFFSIALVTCTHCGWKILNGKYLKKNSRV